MAAKSIAHQATLHKKRRPRRVPGHVILIPLDNAECGFGRVLAEPLIAFYDIKAGYALPIEEIVARPILFKIAVMKYAVTSGRWPVLGNIPLSGELLIPPPFFMRSVATKKLYITYDGSQEIPATESECAGLERLAAWEPEHVESRLNDYFAGRKSAIVESLLNLS